MKALIYEGPRTLDFREADKPTAKQGEQLVRVHAVGICGSDLHAFLGHDTRRPAPLILGHEAAGTIEGGTRDGERVTINPLVACGTCAACRNGRENLCPERQIISMPPREGAFAQYVCVPEKNLIPVPDTTSLDEACLVEPLAVSWHAMRLGAEALHGFDQPQVLIIGGGAIGVAAALAARAMGFADLVIAEPNETRRAFIGETCGFRVTAQATGSYALVVDAVGIGATREIASALASPGGVIMHIGLGSDAGGLDVRRMTLQEISFIGTYTYTAQDFRDTADALYDGRLGPVNWTQTRALSKGGQAFDDLLAGKVAAPKIVLTPWN